MPEVYTGIYNEMFKFLYESINELKEKNENLERKLESQKKELEETKQRAINNNLLICSNIQSITISNGIERIPGNLFNEFNEISEIILPESVLCIDKYAFSKCAKLLQITIPSSVKELGEGSFEGCSSLKEIKIPSTIQNIEKCSFNGCPKLTKIIVYTSKNQYNIIIPKIDMKPKLTPNFSIIANITSLLSPIIFISPENKIICSVKKLKYKISPIFPSQITKPYSINIISFIDEKVTFKIKNLSNPEYKKILSIKDKLNKNKPIQLFIMPPTETGNEPEILILKGNLNIQAGSFEPYILPFELSLEILPLKFRLRCIEYQLAEENKALRLCCDRIVSESEINFEVLNYFTCSHSILAIELESLEENEAIKPDFKVDKLKKGFTIFIPGHIKITRCHFNIIITLFQNITTVVHCDFVIIPIDFDFEIYDFISKRFESSQCQIMLIPNSIITLTFKVTCPLICKQMGYITFYLPQSMKITSESIPINHKFEINGDFNFNLKLHNDNNNYYYSSYNRFNISLTIGHLTKTIQIKFVKPSSYSFDPDYPNPSNNEFLIRFPCYSYNYDLKKWIMIKNNNELMQSKTENKYYVIVTPFTFYLYLNRFNIIDYHRQYACVSNRKNIMYYKLTLIDNENKLFIESPNNNIDTIRLPLNFFIMKLLNYYSIFGYDKNYKNFWFPAFCKYPDIEDIHLLEYDEENIEIAKSNILSMTKSICRFTTKEIEKIFSQSYSIPVDQTNFVIFMALLTNKSIVLNIRAILSKMPNDIQKQFAGILSEIKNLIKYKKNDNMFIIISHNLIFKFAQVFAAKYNELESHQFCLQSIISNQEIKNQQEKALKEFMEIKTCHSIQSKSSLLVKEIEELVSQLLSLPNKSQWKECFIISEKNLITPCLLKDNLGKLNFNDSFDVKSIFSDTIDPIASLPEIKLPQLISIQNMNKFYSICSQGAFLLPAYLIDLQIKKISQKGSELYFAILLDIYKEVIKESTLDESILSHHINSFVKSFNICVIRLKNAGVDFKNLNLPPSCDIKFYYKQGIIWSPEIETPTLKHAQWKIKSHSSDPSLDKDKLTADNEDNESGKSDKDLSNGNQ